jgi:hypothetical protein
VRTASGFSTVRLSGSEIVELLQQILVVLPRDAWYEERRVTFAAVLVTTTAQTGQE